MKENITVTLTKEEYLQYLRQQVYGMKQYRGYTFWIRTSIPRFLVCSTLYFQWYQHLWISMFVVVSALLWILFGADVVWRIVVHHRITQQVLDTMKLKGFQQITMHFLQIKLFVKMINDIP